jgi:DNA repair exonuclease SbcCD ATPase subunit
MMPLAKMSGGGFRAFHAPECVEGLDEKGNVIQSFYLPYIHEASPDQVGDELGKLIKKTMAKYGGKEGKWVLYAHYAFAGSKTGSKNIVLQNDYLTSKNIQHDLFDAIFFGHIHKQQVIKTPGKANVCHPGSPFICDFGERDDDKGYMVFDTATMTTTIHRVAKDRKWIQVGWDCSDVAWGERDIVKFVGEYPKGVFPKEVIKSKIAKGEFPEPFFKTFDIKKEKESRQIRGSELRDASGMKEAALAFLEQRWPGDPSNQKVGVALLEIIHEDSKTATDKVIYPTSISLTNFMSHKSLSFEFPVGDAVLLSGPNGLGKTNIFEGLLMALTGTTSKKVKLASLVRQGSNKAVVKVDLHGDKNDYRITRTISLSAKGVASQKVKVGLLVDGEERDSLLDGGVIDSKEILNRLIGASFLGIKAASFMFQKDQSPIIDARPAERKMILADIFGFDALLRGYKKANETRLAKQREVETAKSHLEGLSKALEASVGQSTPEALEEAKKGLSEATARLLEAETHADSYKRDLVAAGALKDAAEKRLASIPDFAGQYSAMLAGIDGLDVSFKREWDARAAEYRAAKAKITELAARIAQKEEAVKNQPENEAALASAIASVAEAGKASLASATALQEVIAAVRELTASRTGKEAELAAISANDIGVCSKCKQPIDSKHIEAEIKEIKAAIAILDPKLAAAKAKMEEAKKADAEKTAALEAAKSAKEQAEAKVHSCRVEMASLEESRLALVSQQESSDSIVTAGQTAKAAFEAQKSKAEADAAVLGEKVKANAKEREAAALDLEGAAVNYRLVEGKVEAAVKESASAREAVQDRKLAVAKIESTLEATAKITKSIEEKKAEVSTLAGEFQFASRVAEVLDPKAGLPVYLIDNKLPQLEDSINKYFELFGVNDDYNDLRVKLVSQSENGEETLDILIDNGTDPMLEIEAYSGGQLARIEICIKLALSDVASEMRDVSFAFIAYDEPALNLDKTYKARFLEIVQDRALSGKAPVALTISHDDRLSVGFRKRFFLSFDQDGKTIFTEV